MIEFNQMSWEEVIFAEGLSSISCSRAWMSTWKPSYKTNTTRKTKECQIQRFIDTEWHDCSKEIMPTGCKLNFPIGCLYMYMFFTDKCVNQSMAPARRSNKESKVDAAIAMYPLFIVAYICIAEMHIRTYLEISNFWRN